MEYNLEEFDIRFLENRIIVIEQKEEVSRMTKEGAIECTEKMNELCAENNKSKGVIFHVKSLYIKKDVIRVFSNCPSHEHRSALGLVSTSFISKNVAGIFLKMRTRYEAKNKPMELFPSEEEAIEWVRAIIPED